MDNCSFTRASGQTEKHGTISRGELQRLEVVPFPKPTYERASRRPENGLQRHWNFHPRARIWTSTFPPKHIPSPVQPSLIWANSPSDLSHPKKRFGCHVLTVEPFKMHCVPSKNEFRWILTCVARLVCVNEINIFVRKFL